MNSAMTAHPPGFTRRVLTAGAWLLGSNLVSQGLRLVSSLVLTRLLLPEAFGLVAVVQTLYFALVMFSDLGVWQSVVTNPRGNAPAFLGTAMTMQLARGVLLALVVLAIAAGLQWCLLYAPFTPGTVYADARLPPMVAAFALCALLQGAESMHLATAQRELQLRLLTRLELLSQLVGMLVTIGLALATRSVWSLVVGTLVATLTRTVLSHLLLSGPPYRMCWEKSCAIELVSFGKWIFLSSIIGFAASNGEKLILGGTLPTAAFGTFSIAALLLAAISGLIGNLNAHLVFPSLSEALRSGEAAAQRVYTSMQQVADAILGVIAGGTFVAGGWVVHLLYDSRYAGAAWMLQLLGLGLLAIRYQVLEQMMFARGKPAWVTLTNALRATSLVIFVPLGYAWAGERGAVMAVVVSQFVGWPVSIVFKIRAQLMRWQSEVVWPFSLAIGMGAGWLLDKLLLNWSVTRAFHLLAAQ